MGGWSVELGGQGTSGRLWPQALVYIGCVLALCAGSNHNVWQTREETHEREQRAYKTAVALLNIYRIVKSVRPSTLQNVMCNS